MRTILKYATILTASVIVLAGCQTPKPNTMSTVAPGMAFPREYNPTSFDELKIVSWNVEHFVDTFDNPYINNSREDNPPGNMIERIKLLGDALREIDADIVVLQEFESEAFARELAKNDFPELGYQFFSSSESATWYMNVVIMSRVPLGVHYGYGGLHTPITGFTNEDGSEQTQININTRMWSVDVIPREDYVFTLTGLHLKAGRRDQDIASRQGQFRFLKGQFDRILAERPDANLMVVGDLNSLPDSLELLEFLEPVSRVRFINPTADEPVMTHTSDNPERQLDYILYNDKLEPELVEGSVAVAKPFDPQMMELISDHLPMIATIKVGDL